jgi:glucose/arabinose dehydrogenase
MKLQSMKIRLPIPYCIFAASLLGLTSGFSAFPTLKLHPVALKQIHAPTNLVPSPDGSGRTFICDQPGKIHILKNGMILPQPFLDVGGKMVSITTSYTERGLLGMAFHPGYADSQSPGYRKFYLNYSALPATRTLNPSTPQDHVSVIAEFQVSLINPDLADLSSERIVLTTGRPQSNHNGGQLEFGPDGFLYFGSGDGGSSNDNNAGHTGGSAGRPSGILGNGQDRRTLLGKILRIDPLDPDGAGPLTYAIPAGNPFVGQFQDFTNNTLDGDMRGEIYAFGLRNPWRFCFDKRPGGSGRLFCGDVGQGKVEEVNLVTSGGNYGWRYREGTFDFDPQMVTNQVAPASSIDPVAQYAHPSINIGNPALPQLGVSITGGFVYRGAAIPALVGKYLFGDYGSTGAVPQGRFMGLEETAPGNFTLTAAVPLFGGNPIAQRLLTFGEDAAGEIYVGTKTTNGPTQLDNGFPAGGIYRVVAADFLTSPYQAWLTTYFPTLLTGQYLDPEGDTDGDGIGNQIEYAYGFSPQVPNAGAETLFTTTSTAGIGDSVDFTITFRRSPAATDLTYRLQTTVELVNWTTIATSAAGNPAVGANGGTVVSDTEIVGQAPQRLVTVTRNLTQPAGARHFTRLHTSREP